MKKLFTVLFLLIGLISFSQSIGYFRYDSTRLEKVGGNNELILLNGTRSVTNGVLTNIGNGRTAFVTPTAGVAGGNLGSGYRYYVPSSQGIKTTIADNGLTLDSATSNTLTYKLGGSLSQITTIDQLSNAFYIQGSGQLTIGNAVSGSQARVVIRNPTSLTQSLLVGNALHSNNVYMSVSHNDTLTTANNKSTGLFNQYKHVVQNNMTLSGWGFGSHFTIVAPDTMRLDPVGSDLAGAALFRTLIEPNTAVATGKHTVKGGTFRDDHVGGVISMVENTGTTSSNWVHRKGYWASFIAHHNFGNSKDSIETWTGYWVTNINAGYGQYANLFYAGPVGGFDTVRSFYSPYQNARFHQAAPAYFGSAVDGNPYIAAPSAQVEIYSTTKGVLLPRQTGPQQNAISSPATGLLIYNTDSSAFTYYNGSVWRALAAGSGGGGGGTVTNVATDYGLSGGPITTTGTLLFDSATVFTQLRSQMWTLGGNAATAGSQTGSFLGTTNSVQLRIRTNNQERGVWDSAQAQLRIGGVSRNTADGMRIKNPDNDNYSGYYVESNSGTTGSTFAYAGITRPGAFTIKMTSGNLSVTPSLYVGAEFTGATALLHIKGGTATANTAPLKFTAGTLLSTIEAFAKEANANGTYQTSNALNRYAEGGYIADFYTEVTNSGTSETDLYSYTTKANTFAANGEKIIAEFSGTTTGSATATRTWQVYFAGASISTSQPWFTGVDGVGLEWNIKVIGIRESSSVIRWTVTYVIGSSGVTTATDYTRQTGLTLSGTNVLKITGQAGGTGAGSDQIKAEMGTIAWYGAANN